MATLIKNRQVVADTWLTLKPGEPAGATVVPEQVDVIVPLALWREQRQGLLKRSGNLGVRLANTDDPAVLATDLAHFAIIAIEFPSLGDGRGFSSGRLLRERFGFKGELRAVGDVILDHVPLLHQCGFDAIALRDDQDIGEALRAFDTFSDAYQATVAQPVPLFRRRFA